MNHLKWIINCLLIVSSIGLVAQDSARTVQYHSQDIIPIRAKLKYTTLIELPTTEKIMEAATGDKDFWIVDVVGNFCFVHPAKQGISSNLNLITDKGNIYSFTLQDISGSTPATSPDLKVIVEPADRSAIVAASGPPQFVPAAQLEQSRQQLAALQSHVEQAVDEYKSAYPTQLKFDYVYKANEAPFDIQSIYHDDKFTYIKTKAPEKFSVYEMKDGKPNLVTYDLREGTYIIPKIMDSGYVWGDAGLEWSMSSPPPPYNFLHVPTVSGRDPMWEDPPNQPVVGGIARRHTRDSGNPQSRCGSAT